MLSNLICVTLKFFSILLDTYISNTFFALLIYFLVLIWFKIFLFYSGTATRLSIRRGRSNSRAYKYSLAVHEPEIQACNSPISGQDAIEECNEAEDDVGELEQVKQLGGEKTESFFTR